MGVDSLQYEDDFDDTEEDEESLESDLAEPKTAAPVIPIQKPQLPQKAASRRLRVRPMTMAMSEKHPDVISIMLTRNDGRQLVFVRK